MSDDKWAEAWSRLTNAVEFALEAGMTQSEIEDAVLDACVPGTPIETQPKRPKKPKRGE